LERKREREGLGQGPFGKRRGAEGVFGLNGLLPPWFAAGQRQGRLGQRRPAGLPATAAASERGNRERAMRGFPSLTHLGLGRAVEAAPREGSGAATVLGGGGAVELEERGEGCCEVGSGEVRRPGEQPAPFIGAGRRFGGEIFFRPARLRRARAASLGGAR
jgi:hypothetical protein